MSPLTQLAAEFLADQPITVRLRAADGSEFAGDGYAPQTIRGEWNGERIVWPIPRWEFSAYGGKIAGFTVEMGGGEIHAKQFRKPFTAGGPGDWIEIKLNGKPKV